MEYQNLIFKKIKNMKTIKIHGKEYVEVKERIKEFRTNDKYTGWSLSSEIYVLNESYCVIIARVHDENSVQVATGTAFEKQGISKINKESFVENCETSAFGRALGCLGIGIDGGVSSADEIAAISDDKKTIKQLIRAVQVKLTATPNKELRQMLKEKAQAKELTIEFLKNVLNQL